MSKWAQRATAYFSQDSQNPPPKTDETLFTGVLGVGSRPFPENAKPSEEVLLSAAMKACDAFNDSDEARWEMRRQVLATPMDLRVDLLDHFVQAYGGRK